MEQSGGRSRVLCWELVGLICFAGGDTSKQGETRGNKGKQVETSGNKWKQGETRGKQGETRGNHGKPWKPNEPQGKQGGSLQSTKEILSNQWDSFLTGGGNTLPLSGNAKRLRVMVGIVLLVVDIVCWRGSDTEGTKGNEGRRWRGVGPAGRPSLFSFGGSVILKSDCDMTKEEAKEKFGDNIINELLSLGAEPTNVCRNDDIVEWCSDGCIKVGDIEVWAYYYFYEGENPDLCNWEDRMKIDTKECFW